MCYSCKLWIDVPAMVNGRIADNYSYNLNRWVTGMFFVSSALLAARHADSRSPHRYAGWFVRRSARW
jgi:hypothetical protein